MKLYTGVGGREKNHKALTKNISNEEPTAGAVIVQTCLPWKRISHIAYQ